MFYINTTIVTYWCHISKGYIDYHTYLSMDSILMYQGLGIQARILGNSITEMKAFYRTYYCKI